MKSFLLSLVFIASASLVLGNTAPTVVIQSAQLRPGTTLMDVVYRVNDPDDATVKTRALAFVDGVRSFANVLKPVTFVEGTAANLGDAIPSNADHTLTWDVATDWDVNLGQVKFEVLAIDGRGLLPIDWITIPAAGGNPALTISKDAPTDTQLLDAFFWQYASADPGLVLTGGVVRGNGGDVFKGIVLVEGASVRRYATPYILKQMNLAVADYGSIRHSIAARASLSGPDNWHALNAPWTDIDLIVGWGSLANNVTLPPSGLTDVIDIEAGTAHAIALLEDGTVVGWGSNSSGQATPPSGLVGVTAISAGPASTNLALLNNGTVVGWGLNNFGQATPPAGLSNVIAIAAGSDHSLALLGNGTVVGWGRASEGQTNPPAGLSNVVAIAAGYRFSLALLSNGTVVAWGSNANNRATPPAGLANVVSIAAGDGHGLARLSNGTVVGWGLNTDGQASPPAGLANVAAIDGGLHSLALMTDGSVIGWGRNYSGEASPPATLTDVSAIAAGNNNLNGFSLALIKSTP